MAEEDREEEFVAVITGRCGLSSTEPPKDDVRATVLAARRDLQGRIVPDALGEVLRCLAHYRLILMSLTRA